jgi:hypothetical protein
MMTVRKQAFRFKVEPIQISSEEILADLLYPAPSVSPKATPEPKRRRPFRS